MRRSLSNDLLILAGFRRDEDLLQEDSPVQGIASSRTKVFNNSTF